MQPGCSALKQLVDAENQHWPPTSELSGQGRSFEGAWTWRLGALHAECRGPEDRVHLIDLGSGVPGDPLIQLFYYLDGDTEAESGGQAERAGIASSRPCPLGPPTSREWVLETGEGNAGSGRAVSPGSGSCVCREEPPAPASGTLPGLLGWRPSDRQPPHLLPGLCGVDVCLKWMSPWTHVGGKAAGIVGSSGGHHAGSCSWGAWLCLWDPGGPLLSLSLSFLPCETGTSQVPSHPPCIGGCSVILGAPQPAVARRAARGSVGGREDEAAVQRPCAPRAPGVVGLPSL